MTEFELERNYCERCEDAQCYRCEAFAEHLRTDMSAGEFDGVKDDKL